jgi:MAF protein
VSEKNILVLASNSQRRQQLLALGGWNFNVLVADVDESAVREGPGDYVLRLAETKARKSAEKAGGETVMIAADTANVDAGDILGKPAMVRRAPYAQTVERHTHQVYTGLALLRVSDGQSLTDLTITDVLMRAYGDEEIDAYVRTGDPLDKAGAYAIQHPRFQPVESLRGCFASVMGLPLCRLTYLLGQFGIAPETAVGVRCRAELQYDCLISGAVLHGEPLNSHKGEE